MFLNEKLYFLNAIIKTVFEMLVMCTDLYYEIVTFLGTKKTKKKRVVRNIIEVVSELY